MIGAREPVERIAEAIDLRLFYGIDNHPKVDAAFRLMFHRPNMRILMGGSGGGGKTHGLRYIAAAWSLRMAALGCKSPFVVASKDYPGLKDRIVERMANDFSQFGQVTSSQTKGLHFAWADCAIPPVMFRNLADPNARKGSEFGGGGVEELTELTREEFGAFEYLVRDPGAPCNPIVATSNPDGIGFEMAKGLFRPENVPQVPVGMSDPAEIALWALESAEAAGPFAPEMEMPDELDYRDWVYVPFLPDDNPTHDEQQWWARVANLPRAIQIARRYGLWNAPEGARWPVMATNRSEIVVDMRQVLPFGIPPEWKRSVYVDWGIGAPFCALFVAWDPEGNPWVYDENYEANLSTQKQVDSIRAKLGPDDPLWEFIGDPAMWEQRRNPHTAVAEPSVGETYQRLVAGDERFRCGFEPGPRGERRHKFATVDGFLEPLPGNPRLRIDPRCRHLIKELTNAVWAKDKLNRRMEDIDDRCADHAITALVYGIHRKTRTSMSSKQTRQEPRRNPWQTGSLGRRSA